MTREEIIAYGNDYYRDLITACCEIDEKHKEFVRMSLEALEKEPRWIPVTERLPSKLTNVNIAFDDCPNEYDVAYLRTTVNETYRKNGAENEWVSLMGEATYADYEVSAWMEIKPYKAESEET